MFDIQHKVGILCSVKEIYNALTTDEGLSRWWTTETSGAGDVGSVIEFRFGSACVEFEVVELKTDVLVCWRHTGEMPEAWSGTEITFQLTQQEKQVMILFKHSNWKEQTDFMAHCSMKWAVFMLSLKEAIETGKGRPFPDDIQIDHN